MGDAPSNMRLMMLGILRCVGRGWTHDDTCEASGVSIDTNREFMDHFLNVVAQFCVLNG